MEKKEAPHVNEKKIAFSDSLMSITWPYLIFFTLIFCEAIALISRFLVNTQEFSLLTYFSEGLGFSAFSLLLIPVVLISLKWAKSYLFLSILSLFAYIVQVYFWTYAIQSVDMTGYIGNVPLYDKGVITTQGWVSILISPFSVATIFAFFIFLKQRFSKKLEV